MQVSLKVKSVPTKRAADWWDSAAFSGIFLASGFFLLSSRIPARPPAANANRYVASARAVLSLVRVIGEGVLELVGSGGDQHKNLHNITSRCTRPDATLWAVP
jgi:hypothetical protein